jgi:peptidoglycan/LPS O-acetylase OafA/YrhL
MMTIRGRSDEIVAEEKEEQKGLRRLDRAYACYAYVGLFAIAVLAVVTVPVSTPDAREGYGMALVLPSMVLPIVLVAAIVLTVRLRRHRALVLLGLSTVFLVLLIFAVSVSDCCSEGPSEYAVNVVLGMYGAGAALVPVRWFATGRRHYRQSLGNIQSDDRMTH